MSFLVPSSGASRPSRRSVRAYWATAVTVWMAMIGFSSTSLAGSWSERAFHAVSILLFQRGQPAPGTNHLLHFIAEKSVHVCLFAIFAALLWNALPQSLRRLESVVLAGAGLGCGSEFLQRFFPGRDPAWRDVCLNATAATLGAVISLRLCRATTRQESVNGFPAQVLPRCSPENQSRSPHELA